MPIKKELLEILACPACRGKIDYNDERDTLDCQSCRRRYPIRDEIPVMLVEEAELPAENIRP
ncbi:MAG TPA: Trm112 family protein [Candidatus Rifleibacterium sp.]|nr:Trm112 family protein [Candidatus Rifleibacterium sp.]HPT47466.1 Trm112 family protein [Candidatus Rifleibacterium sp.]